MIFVVYRRKSQNQRTSVRGLFFGRFKDFDGVFAGLLGCVECLVGTACNILRICVSVVLAKANANR